MKFHKKVFTHYLSCTSPVDKEGYLSKKKMRTATFHRRWFVLKGNLLFYQERPADRHLLGVIVLEGCAVRGLDAGEEFAFSLVFGPGLKTYTFAAESRSGLVSWMAALASASHSFLSRVLTDLERQYEEVKQHQVSRARRPSSSLSLNRFSLLVAPEPPAGVRERRSASTSAGVPSAPSKGVARKSPKPWSRRNAYVTPLNGPAPSFGEWPLVGSDTLEEFSKLHEHYGQEVKRVREEWVRSKQEQEDSDDRDLIDLG